MLLPHAADVDPLEVYAGHGRPPGSGRPWLVLNMVASADGATAVDGRSGSLGGEADHAVFAALRAAADVVLVAGGTVRAEGYGPPRTVDAALAGRAARGQDPHPRLAVVSGSLDLDPAARLFADAAPDSRPLVVTAAAADPARRARLEPVAELVEAGAERVDLGRALEALGARGARVVLCEGGPSLNGQLAAGDLIDELCLTVAPYVVAGDSARVVKGGPADVRGYELAHVLVDDGALFLRYLRRR